MEPAGPAPTGTDPHWQVPRLDPGDRLVGGVAAAIARELGLDALWVRLAFVLLAAAGGWGVLVYGATWVVLAWYERDPSRPPPAPPRPKGTTPTTRALGFAFVVLGLLGLIDAVGAGSSARVVWPVGLLGLGLLVAWRHGVTEAGGAPVGPRAVQVAVGLVLAAGGTTALLLGTVDLGRAWGALLAGGAVVVGLGVLSAPWWLRLANELDRERQRRIRADERAEVAAHLHDSVLQTLSLIQRNAGDPQAMVALARRQERELRNWLDPDRVDRLGGSLRGQLDQLATDVEQLHGVPVEVVVVGDCLVDDPVAALVAAAREAVVNAARHSGAARVDVYAEARPDGVEVFVRDTGRGFDPGAVAADRRGVRDSIGARMARAGGTAEVSSRPGEGTEVELRLPRPAEVPSRQGEAREVRR
jgi:signal transduction histidine kinase/phage shock protein PspC (stress-responsive transcriptional regulator)